MTTLYKEKALEIGAFDGLTMSNTCFFEKELGWKGICVEPNPDTFSYMQLTSDQVLKLQWLDPCSLYWAKTSARNERLS
jgi:hypothetical protein